LNDIDGGTTWATTLTYYGANDLLSAILASSPVASLAYNANASYYGSQSAFSITLTFRHYPV
jgi:hypothetical protein